MSGLNETVTGAARAAGRIAALGALLGAGLLLGLASADPVEKSAKPAAGPVKVSPYVRYAREHARTAEKVPVRVRPSSSTVHGARGGARASSQ